MTNSLLNIFIPYYVDANSLQLPNFATNKFVSYLINVCWKLILNNEELIYYTNCTNNYGSSLLLLKSNYLNN